MNKSQSWKKVGFVESKKTLKDTLSDRSSKLKDYIKSILNRVITIFKQTVSFTILTMPLIFIAGLGYNVMDHFITKWYLLN